MSEKFIRHFYHPNGIGHWYVLEQEQEQDNIYFYGFVDLVVPEWGYFNLKEITEAGAIEDQEFKPTKTENITLNGVCVDL